jgi:hypothetical protein
MYSGLENNNIGANYYAEDWGVWEDSTENEAEKRNEATGLPFSQ